MENPTSIHEALSAVMADVQAVGKKDRNSAQGFNFRGIDAVVNAVGPAFRKHKVIVTPSVRDCRYSTVEIGKNRTAMGHVLLEVEYTFTASDGSSLKAVVFGEAMDSGDKAVSKAMSVAFRTALLQTLSLPTDEPDPDATSFERAEPLPVAGLEEFNKFHAAMSEAADRESLTAIATAISGVNFSPSDKQALRKVYTERFAALEA